MYTITIFLFFLFEKLSFKPLILEANWKKTQKQTLKSERKAGTNGKMVEGMISVTPDSILHERKPKLHSHSGFSSLVVLLKFHWEWGWLLMCKAHSPQLLCIFSEHKQSFKRSTGTTKEHKLQLSFETCPVEVRLFSVLTAVQMAEMNPFICFILAWKVELKRKGAIGVQLEVYCCGRAQEVVLF